MVEQAKQEGKGGNASSNAVFLLHSCPWSLEPSRASNDIIMLSTSRSRLQAASLDKNNLLRSFYSLRLFFSFVSLFLKNCLKRFFGECSGHVFDASGTLSGHFLDTPEQGARRSSDTPSNTPVFGDTLGDTSGPKGPTDSCSRPGRSQVPTPNVTFLSLLEWFFVFRGFGGSRRAAS